MNDTRLALKETTKSIEHIAFIIQDLTLKADERLQNIEALLQASYEINSKVAELHKINDNIKYIDNQVSLLSINTAIEAAHFHVDGKAFSVIAKEMKNLADKSRNGTSTMTELFADIENKTNRINQGIADARLNAEVNSVAMQEITASIQEILSNVEQILEGV